MGIVASAHDSERLAPGSADPVISHFIPSVELTGSREDKLRKLDTLIVYLHQLRERLDGDAAVKPLTGALFRWSARQWFTAGFLLGAVCVLLLLAGRRWGL